MRDLWPWLAPSGHATIGQRAERTGQDDIGQTSIPTFTRGPVSGPPANITLIDAAPATGPLDPVTGEVMLSTSFNVSIEVPLLSSTCSLGPVGPVDVANSRPVPAPPAFTG